MKRNISVIILSITLLCFAVLTAYGAVDDPATKETFGQKARSFIQRLIDYPANVLQGSSNVASNTAKQGTAIVTNEVKRAGQVITGDLAKTKEMITEPLTGTAEMVLKTAGDAGKDIIIEPLTGTDETALKTVKETGRLPVEAVKE